VTDRNRRAVDRRTVLGTLASLGTASLAGCGFFERDEDGPTTGVDDGEARDLAVQFAPTVYFDEAERWFPTDPRPYESDGDGGNGPPGGDGGSGGSESPTRGLGRVAERLAETQGDLPEEVSRAVELRLDQAQQRTDQAQATDKL